MTPRAKGRLISRRVFEAHGDAVRAARVWREPDASTGQRRYSARIYRRHAMADGESFRIYVVIIRELEGVAA